MPELKRTVPVLVVTIFVFFAHRALHIEPATVAMTGATVMLFVSRQPLERSLASIEWPTLFFFIGLFVHRGRTGAHGRDRRGRPSDRVGDAGRSLRRAARHRLGLGRWAPALVDNIPFTAAMIPVVDSLQGDASDDAYWWALSLGACFGGNATLVAAAANVAAAGLASRAGQPIGFMYFIRIGVARPRRLDAARHDLPGRALPMSSGGCTGVRAAWR